jgi:hypothetical protein
MRLRYVLLISYCFAAFPLPCRGGETGFVLANLKFASKKAANLKFATHCGRIANAPERYINHKEIINMSKGKAACSYGDL